MPLILNGTTGVSGVDGSAGTPSYQGTDTNTGIFYPAADTIAFAEGGTEVMRIDSSGNVGIGTSSPNARLDVQISKATAPNLILTDTQAMAANVGGIIQFAGNDGVNATRTFARISGNKENATSGNYAGYLSFETRANGSAPAEAMRITSSGNVGIASTTANTPLQVWGTTNSGYATSNSVTSGSQAISNSASLWNGSSLRLTANFGGAVNYTGRASELVFGADNGNFGAGGGFGQANLGAITAISEVGNAATLASSMIFYTTAGNNISERMRITSGGDLQFNSGYGSVATAFGCRAWVNFNGTGTVAIRGSGNVSSIGDNGTGNYTINLTTAMPDANYSAVAIARATGNNLFSTSFAANVSAGSFNIITVQGSTATTDTETVCCSVFR